MGHKGRLSTDSRRTRHTQNTGGEREERWSADRTGKEVRRGGEVRKTGEVVSTCQKRGTRKEENRIEREKRAES